MSNSRAWGWLAVAGGAAVLLFALSSAGSRPGRYRLIVLAGVALLAVGAQQLLRRGD